MPYKSRSTLAVRAQLLTRHTLMCSWVLILPVLQELEELLRSPLLEETHEWATDGLHFGTGNLGDLAVAEDEGASDLLELEVARDIGVDEDLGELARCNDELGNEINCIVSVAAKLRWRRLIRSEFAVELYTS